MDDMTEFEERFENRVRTFALTGVRPVDSAAVAHAASGGRRRGPWAGGWMRWGGLPLDGRAWRIVAAVGYS